jgi:hypothetical protein
MAGLITGAAVKRIGAWIMLLMGGALGGLLVVCGFMDRAIGRYPSTISHALGVPALIGAGLPHETITWTILCIGLWWWGAVCAFALRPQWGWIVVVMATIASLFFAPLGTAIAVGALLIALGSRFLGGVASS